VISGLGEKKKKSSARRFRLWVSILDVEREGKPLCLEGGKALRVPWVKPWLRFTRKKDRPMGKRRQDFTL